MSIHNQTNNYTDIVSEIDAMNFVDRIKEHAPKSYLMFEERKESWNRKVTFYLKSKFGTEVTVEKQENETVVMACSRGVLIVNKEGIFRLTINPFCHVGGDYTWSL